MNNLKSFSVAILCASASFCLTAVAETQLAADVPKAPHPLSLVTSLEVDAFPHQTFGEPNRLDPEIVEYIRLRLEQDGKLNVVSPAETVLRLYCEGSCMTVSAELTRGHSGPVLWQTTVRNWKHPLKTWKDNHKVADTIVDRLTQDYEKAASETLIHLEKPIGKN